MTALAAVLGMAFGFCLGVFCVFLLCPSAQPIETHKEHSPS